MSRPRAFVVSPASSLWPGGRPLWRLTALGAGLALSAVAVPIVPTLLDEPASAGENALPEREITIPAAASTSATPAPSPTKTTLKPSPSPSATPSESPTVTPEKTPAETKTAPSPKKTTPLSSSSTTTPRATFSPVTVAASSSGNSIVGASVVDCATCASGNRVGYLEGEGSVTVPLDDVAVAGARTLTIVYETDGARDLYVSVNGGDSRELTALPGAGSWNDPATTTMTVTLKKGANTLKFHNPVGPAPDLDQFRIS